MWLSRTLWIQRLTNSPSKVATSKNIKRPNGNHVTLLTRNGVNKMLMRLKHPNLQVCDKQMDSKATKYDDKIKKRWIKQMWNTKFWCNWIFHILHSQVSLFYGRYLFQCSIEGLLYVFVAPRHLLNFWLHCFILLLGVISFSFII